MKKVAFISRTKGTETPEAKAEALRKYAHLEAIIEEPYTGNTVKYYRWDILEEIGKCAEVTIRGGRVVSVRNVPAEILRTLPPAITPDFGNF